MKLTASFDVFDTLLTRRFGTPTSVFLVLGNRAMRSGLTTVQESAFRAQRVQAEAEARKAAPGGEVTLAEIYSRLSSSLGISPSAGEAMSRLELEVEAEFITPVPASLEMVRIARDQSAGVIFVSDMYLPADFIRAQLVRHGFWRDGDRLYVSSEWRASKAVGSLFRTILEKERLVPSAINHTGDRRDADFEVPARMGLAARHLDVCGLTRYEKLLEEFSGESAGFSSLIAGASRLTRLQNPSTNRHFATLREITSSLISPIITLYALWLIQEARMGGIKRLYFVARDGYLVKKIADALIRVLHVPLETRYLYGSRQAWHLPAITEFSGEVHSWLFERTRTFSLRIILGRLQMTPEDIKGILEALGWLQSEWDRPLDEDSLTELKSDLVGSVEFRAQVQRHMAEKREVALQYLEQEGLCEHIPWAIVDLGWHGRLQQSLEKLLNMRQSTRTSGLYFGLYADSPALTKLKTTSYLDWDLRCPPESKDIPSLVFLMESFCTAPHGSTIGYRREADGRIDPCCREVGFAPLNAWGISTVHDTVDEFAERLGELTLSEAVLSWDSKYALTHILGVFSRDPLPAEARAWGAFPYEDEQGGVVRERLTMPYELTWENLQIALTFGEERYLPASWKVLWHGGQAHVQSANNTVLKLTLRAGRVKRELGRYVRRLFGVGSGVA